MFVVVVSSCEMPMLDHITQRTFMAELLQWIALDCPSVTNEVERMCIYILLNYIYNDRGLYSN